MFLTGTPSNPYDVAILVEGLVQPNLVGEINFSLKFDDESTIS